MMPIPEIGLTDRLDMKEGKGSQEGFLCLVQNVVLNVVVAIIRCSIELKGSY
jgi:hypothetical protein